MYFPVFTEKHLGTEKLNLTRHCSWNLELSFSFSLGFLVLTFPSGFTYVLFFLLNMSVAPPKHWATC